MRSRAPSPRDDLRRAVGCLPQHTRVAMLDAIRSNDIIAGAYTDRRGGVCPMLAAHRNGGRTDFLGFAVAWDRFTHARRARRATERELRILTSYLQASLADDPAPTDLGTAIADHQAAARSRREREAARVGRGWLRGGADRDAAGVLAQLEHVARDAERERTADALPA